MGSIIIAVAVFTTFLAHRRPRLAVLLAVAFAARGSATLFHYYLAPLPDGTSDAATFESLAWEWGQEGFQVALGHYTGIDAYFYSWLMAIVYSVTGRSLLLLQSLSMLAGVVGVFVTWRLAREVWDDQVAQRAAWVAAVFPMVVMYSALPMREAYALLFFAAGMLGVVRWGRVRRLGPAVGAFAGFGAATFFHGGLFIAVLAFMAVIGAREGKSFLAGLTRGQLRVMAAFGIAGTISLIGVYVGSGVSVHKLGTAQALVSPVQWMHYFETRVHGTASYPEWVQPQTAVDLIWAIPLRAVYLMFSPFPWDLRSPTHLVALVDGMMYAALVFLVWRCRRSIRGDSGLRAAVIVLVAVIFAFGVGTGNFGTALRHRAKLAAVLIAFASCRLPGLVARQHQASTLARNRMTQVAQR
jgi:4-amino-4-deoxy-L-arabinose transferase-like glycosyltransferase